MMRHMLISTASSSFIVSPANLTTCQDSSAIFQCKTSDDVPIFWLINNATPISAGVPYSPQTQMSTLSIPNSSAFPGASVVCYYLLQPSGNKVVSNEAFLTVIGTALALFNTCNLKLTPFFFHHTDLSSPSISWNHSASVLAWSIVPVMQTPLTEFVIVLILNRQGIEVYNVSTPNMSLEFNISDPCGLYIATVSAVYLFPNTTCIKNSSATLSGGKRFFQAPIILIRQIID